MSVTTLTLDLLDYAKAKGLKLSTSQARALAVLNVKNIRGEELTKGYWKQLNHIINRYLAHQSVTDRVQGTFATLGGAHI